MNSNKQLVRSFTDAGNTNNLNAFDSIITSNFKRYCQATPEVFVTCVDDFKDFYIETAKPFSDQKISSDCAGIFRIEENNIAELWVTWDNLSGISQLGLLPES